MGPLTFSRQVPVGPRERKTVTFSSSDVKELAITNPRIWWPYRMGWW
jgi:hypothetical protein